MDLELISKIKFCLRYKEFDAPRLSRLFEVPEQCILDIQEQKKGKEVEAKNFVPNLEEYFRAAHVVRTMTNWNELFDPEAEFEKEMEKLAIENEKILISLERKELDHV